MKTMAHRMSPGLVAPDPVDTAAASRRRTRHLLLIGVGLSLVLAAAGFGARWFLVGRFLQSTDDAYLQADSAVISPKIAGYIAEVAALDNQRVAAGQVLARIDDRDLRAALDQSEAEVASAAADLRNVEAQIAQQESRLAQARARVEAAGAQSDYAARESERYKGLLGAGAVSLQKAQLAESDVRRLTADLQGAKAALDSVQGDVAVLAAQREKADASLRRAEAAREQARLHLSYTIIQAPEDGVVGDRSVRVGQYVQPGGRLMTIVPTQDVYLIANFKETQLRDMFRGEKVKIALDSDPDLALSGTVDSLAPGTGSQFALLPAENATGNFTKIVQRVPVKIAIDRAAIGEVQLRPGLSATATVDTSTAPPGARTTLSQGGAAP
jgi:membrane fusion protein (multidrug efflux system)